MSSDSSRDLSHIYRAGAQEEPPPWLDTRIRAAAADACRVSQAEGRRGLFARWHVPAAAAAMVTLASSIIWLSGDSPTESDNSPSTAVSRGAMERRAAAGPTAEKRTEPLSPAPGLLAVPDQSMRADHPSPSGSPEVQSARQAPAREAPVARPGPHAGVTEQAIESRPAGGELAKAEALHPRAEAPPLRSRTEHDTAGANAVHSSELAGRVRGQDGVASREPLDPKSGLPYEDPAKWLERIEKLHDDGREGEARASLERFRQVYPAYPVPDKLK